MKTVKIKSAVPLFLSALVWIVLGALLPIYKMSILLIVLAASVIVYIVADKALPAREKQLKSPANTGVKDIDEQIDRGRAAIERLRANASIYEPAVQYYIKRMADAGESIFDELVRDISQANQVRRFMNYYLPTAEKLLIRYAELKSTGSKGENVSDAMSAIESSFEMMATAFEKQLDALYRDDVLDIETDIDVLKTIISGEGLGENWRNRQ